MALETASEILELSRSLLLAVTPACRRLDPHAKLAQFVGIP